MLSSNASLICKTVVKLCMDGCLLDAEMKFQEWIGSCCCRTNEKHATETMKMSTMHYDSNIAVGTCDA